MSKLRKSKSLIVTAALIAVVGTAAFASAANAAVQANGSDGPVYLGDNNSNALITAGSTMAWNDDNFGFTDPANVSSPFVCPSDATGSLSFIAPTGQERTFANWSAYAVAGFVSGKNIVQFTTSPYGQILGNGAAVKAAGGSYSIGVACTVNSNTKLASSGVWYLAARFTAGTGAFTVTQPDSAVVSPSPSPSPSGGSSTSIALQATTAAAQDGSLSLIAPSNATVVFGAATVDPTTHLSTSTGTLGDVTVADGRVVTHTGWDLTTSVTAFTLVGDSTKTIANSQLGFLPKFVSVPTGSNISKSVGQLAGSAVYGAPFASADNGANVGNTVMNAALTFVAPSTSTPGTYNSTMTLTLVGK